MSDGQTEPRLVLATANPGKAREVRALLPDVQVETLAEHPQIEMPPETADTFEGNAAAKAEHVAGVLGLPVLADDSGLVVDALDGAPGVRSARYASGSDADRNRKLLEALAGVPEGKRGARFVCAMALALPGGSTVCVEGRAEGRIAHSPRGTGGFGYDPVFLLPGEDRAMAELTLEEKNRISHRARALAQMIPLIEARLFA